MMPKMNKDHLEIVSGAILATIRKCNLKRNRDTVCGVWSETVQYETYSPGDRLWVQLIRAWQKDERTADKAFTRVMNKVLKRWREQDDYEKAYGSRPLS